MKSCNNNNNNGNHNNNRSRKRNRNNKSNMDAVNWFYSFYLLLSFVVHTTQSIRIDINNSTESINNTNISINETHHFVTNDDVTHETRDMELEETEVQKDEDSALNTAERSRRLIPLMAFYLPISELPLNKQFTLQTPASKQQYEHGHMIDKDEGAHGKFVIVKGVSGNIARIPIPESYTHMKMSSYRTTVPQIQESTHYASSSSSSINHNTERNSNYRTVVYDNRANVAAISEDSTKLPRIVHVLSLKAIPKHHMDDTFLSNIDHSHNNNNNNNNYNINNNNNNGHINAAYASSLSLPAPTTLAHSKEKNPHKFKTVQYFPPISTSTALPVRNIGPSSNNNKQLSKTIQILHQSQNHISNVASAYRLPNSNSKQQQHQQQQQQQQSQYESKHNLTPFTATNTIPGHFIPIVYTPINIKTNNSNQSHNNRNNKSNKYNKPPPVEGPPGATHIFLYDDDEIIKQQAQYKQHYHHYNHLQQQQQQQQQQHIQHHQQQQPQSQQKQHHQWPYNTLYYSATLPAVEPQSSHNQNYYYRHNNNNNNNNKHLQQEQQHLSEISSPRLSLQLSSTNNLPFGKSFILSRNNFNHPPKIFINDVIPATNFSNGNTEQYQQQQQKPQHSNHPHKQQRHQQLRVKNFQPPKLENFFDEQIPTTKQEILKDTQPDGRTFNTQQPKLTYSLQQQGERQSPPYINIGNEHEILNGQNKESQHIFMPSSTLPPSSVLPEEKYSTTTVPINFPLPLQYSTAKILSSNNMPHRQISPESSQYPTKFVGLITPDGHYGNNVIKDSRKQENKYKLPIITNYGTSYVALTTDRPYQEVETTFKPLINHHHYSYTRPFYKTKLKLQQLPTLQIRKPVKVNNNNDHSVQHTPLIEVRPPSPIKSDIKFAYVKEEFGKKITPLSVTSKINQPLNKPVEKPDIQITTTLSSDHLADPNDLPDIRTLSLSEILHKLQESNHLPQTLTPDNIDDSIKTLIRILNNLKQTKKGKTNVSQQQHNDNIALTINTSDNSECTIDNVKPHVQQQDKEEHVKNLGANSGRPGVDYPNYAEIPETSFVCSEQRYKGFFGDPETNCQVWHYCDLNGGKASFLCPNGTIFSQIALTCDWWFNVKCATTPQLYVLNERLYKYILPFTPKFPEDYNGPLVDKYLAMKFQEMEEKTRLEREKVNSPSTSTSNNLDDVDTTTTTDENVDYTTQAIDADIDVDVDIDKESLKIVSHSQKQLISEQSPERNLLIDDEVNDISQRDIEINKFESSTIGSSMTTSNGTKSIIAQERTTTTKSINDIYPLSIKPIVVLSSTIEPDYIESNGITSNNDNDRTDTPDRTDIPKYKEHNSNNNNSNYHKEGIIETTTKTTTPSQDHYKTLGTDTVNVTVEKVKLIEIKSDGTTGHLIPDS